METKRKKAETKSGPAPEPKIIPRREPLIPAEEGFALCIQGLGRAAQQHLHWKTKHQKWQANLKFYLDWAGRQPDGGIPRLPEKSKPKFVYRANRAGTIMRAIQHEKRKRGLDTGDEAHVRRRQDALGAKTKTFGEKTIPTQKAKTKEKRFH